MRLPQLMIALLAFVLISDLPAKTPVTHIKVGAPKVDYRTFPVGRPPMHAKGLAGEAGLCHTEISCKVGVEAEAPGIILPDSSATLRSVTFDISAKITVWCQEGYTPAIMDHEETHRAISEHFYAMAYRLSRRLADEAIARQLTLVGEPREQALDRAVKQLKTQLLDDFMREINLRSEFAQDRFDATTDHGRNTVTNADAKARTLREEAEHWKRKKDEG